MGGRATKSFPVSLSRSSIAGGREREGRESRLHLLRETTRMANKRPQARYIMFSRTHKKTGLRNSNDIMFAPRAFLPAKGSRGGREERKEVGEMRERGDQLRREREDEEKRSEGLKGRPRRQPGRGGRGILRRHGRLRRNIPSKTFHSTRE